MGAKADAAATARAVALAVVVALAGLTACSSAPVGETPESTVAGFYRALGAKDSAAACALVAYDGKPLAGDDVLLCRSGFDTIITDVATPEELACLLYTSRCV